MVIQEVAAKNGQKIKDAREKLGIQEFENENGSIGAQRKVILFLRSQVAHLERGKYEREKNTGQF